MESAQLPPTDIRISGFGGKVQEFAAVVTSFSAIYATHCRRCVVSYLSTDASAPDHIEMFQ